MEKQPYIRLNLNPTDQFRKINTKELVQIIKRQILSNSNLTGCRLPPVRVLALQLGLSKNTIQTAFDELKSQGLIESKDRKGLYISKGPEKFPKPKSMEVPVPEMKKIKFFGAATPHDKQFLNLSSVFVDARILPKDKINACFRSVLKSGGFPEFNDYLGMPALRQKIAKRLQNRGMEVDPEHVIITVGSQQGLDLVTRVLNTRTVATEDPAYWMGKYLFEMNGIQTVGLPVDPFDGINLNEWEKRIAENKPGLAYLTTNFQNPNGYSYTSKEITQIVELAQKYKFGILEDDWGSEMMSHSEFKSGLRAIGGPNVLYMNSFTKKLLPSLRIGYVVANEQTVESMKMAKRVSTIAVSSILESVLFEFLDRGYYDTHLKLMQEEVDARYQNTQKLLQNFMPEEVRWTNSGGGPVIWLEVPRSVNLEKLAFRLKEQKIVIHHQNQGYFGTPTSHGFKLGYAYLSPKEMEVGLSKLATEIRKELHG